VETVPSAIGGGSLPGETLPSWAVVLDVPSADKLLGRLRRATPPVVGRIEAGRVVLDLRTVDPADDEAFAAAVLAVLDAR
jgi:L-seryl-tRNA(Ser) seleniumtransferase